MIEVAAGVLEREGKILIGRRRADQAHAGKWEFPGGKIETGESPATALVRELREELGIAANPGAELMRYEFNYPGKRPILLVFFTVTEWAGEIENRIFDTLLWEQKENLAGYDFVEGDAKFLARFTAPAN